jgi:hypothetical protein
MVEFEDDVGTSYNADPSIYARENSRKFLDLLDSEAPKSQGAWLIDEVLFDDDKILDASYSFTLTDKANHRDHYHIRFSII